MYKNPTDSTVGSTISIPAFWGHLFLSLLAALSIGWLGYAHYTMLSTPVFLGLLLAEFVVLIITIALQKRKRVGYALAYGFVLLSGFTTGVGIGVDPKYRSVIGVSMIETLVVVVVLGIVAVSTRNLFLSWGNTLFAMLVALIIIELLCIFLFHMTSAGWLVINGAGVLIFVGYLMYDVQRAINKGFGQTVPLLVISVYLDILNLLMLILRLNSGFSSRK